MSTRTVLDYVAPTLDVAEEAFTFKDIDEDEEDASFEEEDASQSDIAYYLTTAGRYPLLGAEEERELGFTLWAERSRILRILRGSSHEAPLGLRPASPSTRRRLARVERLARDILERRVSRKRVSRGHLVKSLASLDSARSRLVEHNLRLVVWVAKRFRGRGFDFVDLIQEGSLGLIRAVDRFDPRVGARFSTFATHWIQQGIRRALAEKARTIRIPVNRIPEVRRILSVRARLSAQLGRAARAPEIAEDCGLEVAKVEELLPAIGSIQSIDAPIPSTDKLLSDTLADCGRRSPLEEAVDFEMRSIVKDVLDELPERQRRILAMRHGIDTPKECTLDEIGDVLGLSRERVRQVEKTAATAVRDWLERHRSELAKPV